MQSIDHYGCKPAAFTLSLICLLLTSPSHSLACETTSLVINGNLDSLTMTSDEGFPLPTAPVAEQISAAQAVVTFQVFDSLGQAHSLAALFYRTDEFVWASRILVTDNSLVTSPNLPPASGDNFLMFNAQGQREIIPPADL